MLQSDKDFLLLKQHTTTVVGQYTFNYTQCLLRSIWQQCLCSFNTLLRISNVKQHEKPISPTHAKVSPTLLTLFECLKVFFTYRYIFFTYSVFYLPVHEDLCRILQEYEESYGFSQEPEHLYYPTFKW